MADELRAFLTNLAEDPARPVQEVELLAPEARAQQLSTWNATHRALPHTCIHKLIEAQVDRTPDAVAVACEDRALSYRQLDEASNRVARRLLELGAGPDKPIGVHVERSIELVVAALGVLKAGAAYVPLDPDYPADRIALMIEDARLDVVVTQAALAASLAARGVRSVAARRGSRSAVAAAIGTARRARRAAPPRVPDLHVRFDRQAEGRDGRASQRDQLLLPAWTNAFPHDPAGCLAGGDEPVVRHLGARAVLDAGARLQGRRAYRSRASDAPQPPCQRRARRRRSSSACSISRPTRRRTAATSTSSCSKARSSPTAHGFSAVWTPERHFHAFGGLYPNPAVTSAAHRRHHASASASAPAACVLPLHHPIARRRAVGGRRQPLERPRRDLRSPPAGSRTTSCCMPEQLRRTPRASCCATSTSCGGCGAAKAWSSPGPSGTSVVGPDATRARCRRNCRSGSRPRGTPETFRHRGQRRRQRAHAPARPDRSSSWRRSSPRIARRGGSAGSIRATGIVTPDAAHVRRTTTASV